MTRAERAASEGLLDGEMEGLAALLQQEQPYLHPLIQRHLLDLICGSADQTDYRITVTQHPDLKSAKQGKRHELRNSQVRLGTALRMARNGALRHGQWDAALNATMEQTGLSKATICRHWGSHKRLVEVCAEHGIMNLDEKP